MKVKTKKYIDANWLLTLIRLLPHNGDMISSTEVEETIIEMMNNKEDYIEIKEDINDENEERKTSLAYNVET